jgi:hypothetical protein
MTRNIQQPATNSSSTQIVEVPTSTGFNAGDPVYFKNGNYISPAVTPSAFTNPTGSLTFATSTSVPTGAAVTPGQLVNPVLAGTNASGYGFIGATSNKSAATLTNGNIVQVWRQINGGVPAVTNPGVVYFQIVTPAGAQVVAPTAVSTVYTNVSYAHCMVASLTGGGFVVAWSNGAGGTVNKPCYAIYTNAGAVTLAATNDTTYAQATSSNYPLSVLGMGDGSIALAMPANTGVIWYKIITATGTVTKAWTTTGVTASNPSPYLAMATRSNGEVFIGAWNGTNTIGYVISNASGTLLVTASSRTVTPNQADPYPIDATCLSDGTTFVVAYTGNTNATETFPVCWNTLPTGNVWGTEKIMPKANRNVVGTIRQYFISVLGLSSGGYMLAFTDCTQTIQYAFFNAAGTTLSGTNASGTTPIYIPGTILPSYSRVTLTEVGSYVYMYWTPGYFGNQPANFFTTQVSTSTYLPVYSTLTLSIGTTTSTAASAIDPATSTLTSAKYLLTAPDTQTVSIPLVTAYSTANVAVAANCAHSSCCTAQDGSLLILYAIAASPYTVAFGVYSSEGVLQQTVNVGVTVSSGAQYGLKIVTLTSGKFAIVYRTAAGNNYTLAIYSSTYTFITSTTLPTTYSINSAVFAQTAALSNDKLVIAVGANNATTYGAAYVYDSSASLISTIDLYTATNNTALELSYLAVAGNNAGGFCIFAVDGNNAVSRVMLFSQLSATTWTCTFNTSPQSQTTGFSGSYNGMVSTNSGNYVFVQGSGASGTTPLLLQSLGQATGSSSTYSVTFANTNASGNALGVNAYGMPVFVCYAGTSVSRIATINGAISTSNGAEPANNTYPVTQSSVSVTSFSMSNVSLTWAGGYYMWLVSMNTVNNYVHFQKIATVPFTFPYTISTSQQPTGAAVSINPNNTSSSTTIPNTMLAGVAATTTTAGGAGQLVINGSAQLGSSYNASATGAFDTTGLAVNGVKGIYNGRNVIMQGNS